MHGKNDFAEMSKNNLKLDIDLKIILDQQNNYVEKLSMISNAAKSLTF